MKRDDVQGDLFGDGEDRVRRGKARADGPWTMHNAANQIADHIDTQQERVYNLIVLSGDRGMTTDEIEIALGMMKHQSASPRMTELAEDKRITTQDGGDEHVKMRPTSSGPQFLAQVWYAVTDERPFNTVSKKFKKTARIMRKVLEESLRVQSHYAELLNASDGGGRMLFDSVDKWVERMKETGVISDA